MHYSPKNFNGLSSIGDTEDPESREYQREQQYIETVAIEQARQATLTPEQLAAELQQQKEIDAYISQLSVITPILNKANPATLPLTPIEEQFRQASVAGDFERMNQLMPFSIHRWKAETPLGKYRFNIENGQKIYVSFSDADIYHFLSGPWMVPNQYGFALMIEPGAGCDADHMGDLYVQGQKGVIASYSPTDWQYVFPIYPGLYICQVYRGSAWVRWRGAVITAVGIVAAIYLGPIILDKVAGAATAGTAEATTTGIVGAGTKAGAVTAVTTKATAAAITTTAGAAVTAVETASFFQTVQSGGNKLLSYVNKARTVEAIATGQIPPPPISIVGDSFTDWAMTVAKEQIAKEAKERAMELGIEYVQRKLTEAEEAKLRAEIQAMQAELAALMPANISATPNAQVPAEVQAASAALALREKRAQDAMLTALAIAVPVGLLMFS